VQEVAAAQWLLETAVAAALIGMQEVTAAQGFHKTEGGAAF
jgi:hypothetical protein